MQKSVYMYACGNPKSKAKTETIKTDTGYIIMEMEKETHSPNRNSIHPI